MFKVLFDAAGCLRKFDTPEQICTEFFECRKEIYKKRKRYLEGMLQAQSDQLNEKARFIMMKIRNEIHIENKRKAAIIEQLQKHEFKPDPVKRWKEEQKRKELEQCGEANVSEDEEDEEVYLFHTSARGAAGPGFAARGREGSQARVGKGFAGGAGRGWEEARWLEGKDSSLINEPDNLEGIM